MPKKGKEPAGLRRWRLAQKAKRSARKAARSSPKTRKVKTMARRRYGRKAGKRTHKTSTWKILKGAVYVGAVAAPLYTIYAANGGGKVGAMNAAKHAAFIDTNDGSFSEKNGMYVWAPVAMVGLVDFISSKTGIQRKVSQGIRGILG